MRFETLSSLPFHQTVGSHCRAYSLPRQCLTYREVLVQALSRSCGSVYSRSRLQTSRDVGIFSNPDAVVAAVHQFCADCYRTFRYPTRTVSCRVGGLPLDSYPCAHANFISDGETFHVIPEGFTTLFHEVIGSSETLPMMAVLMNSLSALTELSSLDFNGHIGAKAWHDAPFDNVDIHMIPGTQNSYRPSNMIRTSFAMWGIYATMVDMIEYRTRLEARSTLEWQGRKVGDIFVLSRARQSGNIALEGSTGTNSTIAVPPSALNIRMVGADDLEVTYRYSTTRLLPQQMFMAAYPGIIFAADGRRWSRSPPFHIGSPSAGTYVRLTHPPSGERFSAPFFTRGHIVRALNLMLREAVDKRQYFEMEGALKVNGVLLGQIVIGKRPLPSASF